MNANQKLPSLTTQCPLSFDAPFPRYPREYPYISRNYIESSAYILPLIVWVYLYSTFSSRLHKTFFSATVRFGRSRSPEVIAFRTNGKRVCDFLLVSHSNFGPSLHRFGDIADFRAHDSTPIPP